jgi:hypothetical protein
MTDRTDDWEENVRIIREPKIWPALEQDWPAESQPEPEPEPFEEEPEVEIQKEASKQLHPSSPISPAQKVKLEAIVMALKYADAAEGNLALAVEWLAVVDPARNYSHLKREMEDLVSTISYLRSVAIHR